MIECFERSGANALPIITLIHFLVGLVLAFQASIQLRQFGANIFVADLVGLAQVREFGPLITAVLLAGRSGSAFAAEIGTMQVNEEIDALKTMGLDPTRFLVLPKTMALLLAMPLLTLYADLVGIAGGLVVGVLSLDLTVQGYLLQTRKAVDMFDVFSGVGKTLAFALIVAGVGCLRGFQVRGGAESVGHAATSAVVSGIFLIILVDAIFTVIFQYV
jgi:phospholipid/cholesterol/gamma-HCH transport system permease protein